MTHKLYEEFIKLNPWLVEFEESVQPKVEAYHHKHPAVAGVLEKVVSKLETFPPDENYFQNPRPSLHRLPRPSPPGMVQPCTWPCA